MNQFWPVVASIGVFLAFLYEIHTFRKERDVRRDLHISFDPSEIRDQRLSFMLFFTTLGSLFVAFCILALHVSWSAPKDGVAVVFDSSDSSEGKEILLQERGILQDLSSRLKGVPLSLYERGPTSLSCIVPPTIDRLYFSLMADGIEPSEGEERSLDWMQNQVLENEKNTRPWVVVISSKSIPEGARNLDGMSLLIPAQQETFIKSFDHGNVFRENSFDALITRVTARIFRSQENLFLDGFEKVLLLSLLLVSWISAIHWRRRITPVFWVVFFLLAPNFELSSSERSSENAVVKASADLVDAQEFTAATVHLEKLLPSILDKTARQRMVYNLALVEYLRGNEEASIAWLTSIREEIKDPLLAQISRGLHTLSLIQLVQKDIVSDVWRKQLQKSVQDPLGIPQVILAKASLALLLPREPEISLLSEERTLLFYTQSLNDLFPEKFQGDLSGFITRTQKEVEEGLKLFFKDEIVSLFHKACAEGFKDPFFLIRYKLWYQLSKMKTQEDGIQFLLNEALQTSTESLFFPRLVPLLEKKLLDIQSMLHEKITLPSEISPEAVSAAWYVRARLWKLISRSQENEQQEILLFLASEMEKSPSPLIQKMLVKELLSSLSLSSRQYEGLNPLESLFWQIFLKWFDKNSLDALDTLLGLAERLPSQWTEYTVRLFKERERFFNVPLIQDFSHYDPLLLARLVQIEKTPCVLPQEATLYVARLLHLYKRSIELLKTEKKTLFTTLGVVFEEQHKLAKTLKNVSLFEEDYTKQGIFEGLIDEWTKKNFALRGKLGILSLKELPQIQKDMQRCYDLLLRIHQMLDEKEPSSEKISRPQPSVVKEKHFSIREEEAVRLYQEMDRMDRKLYGE